MMLRYWWLLLLSVLAYVVSWFAFGSKGVTGL